ncbi:hypothetical protein LIA77_11368 [Sarocladium implicatum]|nr:hypothetical protein LIA77_11368 [Sarocladium implicatum]
MALLGPEHAVFERLKWYKWRQSVQSSSVLIAAPRGRAACSARHFSRNTMSLFLPNWVMADISMSARYNKAYFINRRQRRNCFGQSADELLTSSFGRQVAKPKSSCMVCDSGLR